MSVDYVARMSARDLNKNAAETNQQKKTGRTTPDAKLLLSSVSLTETWVYIHSKVYKIITETTKEFAKHLQQMNILLTI